MTKELVGIIRTAPNLVTLEAALATPLEISLPGINLETPAIVPDRFIDAFVGEPASLLDPSYISPKPVDLVEAQPTEVPVNNNFAEVIEQSEQPEVLAKHPIFIGPELNRALATGLIAIKGAAILSPVTSINEAPLFSPKPETVLETRLQVEAHPQPEVLVVTESQRLVAARQVIAVATQNREEPEIEEVHAETEVEKVHIYQVQESLLRKRKRALKDGAIELARNGLVQGKKLVGFLPGTICELAKQYLGPRGSDGSLRNVRKEIERFEGTKEQAFKKIDNANDRFAPIMEGTDGEEATNRQVLVTVEPPQPLAPKVKVIKREITTFEQAENRKAIMSSVRYQYIEERETDALIPVPQ